MAKTTLTSGAGLCDREPPCHTKTALTLGGASPHVSPQGLLNDDIDSLLLDMEHITRSTNEEFVNMATLADSMEVLRGYRTPEQLQQTELLVFETYFYTRCAEMANREDLPEMHKHFFVQMMVEQERCALERPDRSRKAKNLCLPVWERGVGENARIGWTNKKLDQLIAYIEKSLDPTSEFPDVDGAFDRNLGLGCETDECIVPTGLQGIWQYGCWCNFGDRLMEGAHHPINEHDDLCRSMQLCMRCAKMDARNEGRSCDPKTQDFVAAFAFGDQSLVSACTAYNPDICARDVCTCQMALISGLVELVWVGYIYDPAPRHISEGGTFDYRGS